MYKSQLLEIQPTAPYSGTGRVSFPRFEGAHQTRAEDAAQLAESMRENILCSDKGLQAYLAKVAVGWLKNMPFSPYSVGAKTLEDDVSEFLSKTVNLFPAPELDVGRPFVELHKFKELKRELEISLLLKQLEANSVIPIAKDIVSRVRFLNEEAKKAEEIENLSSASLRYLVLFLNESLNLLKPALVLTPVGNIRAVWRKGADKHFAVEFNEDGNVYYVLFKQNSLHSDRISRSSGIETYDSVLKHYNTQVSSPWIYIND